ncbi:MAG: DUF5655 domain-containing protein [Coriobacteriaceae bacterium]|nr:DUF5655 domain-containing protein [Coriobacteriaceae bacterium]
MIDADTLRFFDGREEALPLYEAFEERLCERFPEAGKRVQKTQITFFNRHVFACVSFARVLRKAELPDPYIVVTLGLSHPLDSERVAVKVEPYPGRWTTHLVIGDVGEIDDELLGWLDEAYAFAEAK